MVSNQFFINPSQESQLQAQILEQISDAVIATDIHQCVIYCNRTALNQYKLEECEILGKPLQECFTYSWEKPEDEQLAWEALETQGYWQGENIHGLLDGTEIFVESRMTILRDGNGNSIGMLATIRDISDRKKAELALSKSKSESAAILSAIPDLMFRMGADGIYRDYLANQEFALVSEIIDIKGRSMSEILAPDHADRQFYYLQKALETGEVQIYEQTFQLSDRTLEEEVRVVKSGEDEVLFIVRDISDRKQAELALKESEAKSQAILSAIPDLMFRMSADGVHLECVNHRELSLVSPDIEILGRTMTEILPEELAIEQSKILQKAIETGELQVREQRFQLGDRIRDEELRVIKSREAEALFMIRDISDRKEAERALQESESRFRRLADYAPMLIWMSDVDKQCFYFNQTWLDFTGRNLEQELGEGWMDAVHPEDLPHCLEISNHSFDVHHNFEKEYRLRRYDGEYCWILDCGAPRFDGYGNFLGYIGSCIDIDDRKELQKQLLDSEAKLNDILNSVRSAVIRLIVGEDGSWCIDYVSNGCEAICGYSAEELTTKKNLWVSRIDPADWQAIEPQIYEDIFIGREGNHTYRLQHRDGSWRWISQMNTSRWDINLNAWIVTVISADITDQKRIEIDLQRSKAALLEAQAIVHIGSWEFDIQSQRITWSPELFRIFGLDPNQPEPTYAEYLQLIHPEDSILMHQCVEQAINHGTPYQIDYRLILPDDSVRYHEGKAEIEWDERGQVKRLFGTALDITDRVTTQMALEELNRALQHSEAKSRAILAAIPDLMIRANTEGVHLEYVGGKRELCIIPEDVEMVGRAMADLIPADVWQRHSYHIEKALETGELQVYEQTVQLRDRPHHEEVRLIKYAEDEVLFIIRDINARKQAEFALKESEIRKQAIIDAIPDLLLRVNRDGTCLECLLPHGTQAGKYLPINNHLSEVLPPDILENHLQAIERAIATGELQIYNQQLIKFGKRTYEEVRVAAINNSEALVIVRDTTAQVELGKRLEEISHHIPGMIYQYRLRPDGSSHFPYTSQGIRDIYDVLPEDVCDDATVILDRLHPADLDYVSQGIADSAQYLTIWQNEYRVCLPDGRMIWVNGQATPQRQPDGSILWHGYITEITTRKQSEEALRELNQELERKVEERTAALRDSKEALQISERRFRSFFEFAPIGMTVIDIQTYKLVAINSALCQMLGYSETELQELTAESISVLEDWQSGRPHLESLISGDISFYKLEKRYITKNGDIIIGNLTATLIKDDSNNPTYILAMVEDITEQVLSQKALQKNEAYQRALILAIPDLILRMNDKGYFLDVFAGSHFRLTHKREELQGVHVSKSLPPLLAQKRLDFINLALQTESIQVYEQELLFDSIIQTEEVRIVPYTENEVLALIRNISDRKDAERALAESEKLNRQLVSQFPIGLATCSLDGRYTFVNQAFADLIGRSIDECLQLSLWDITPNQYTQESATQLQQLSKYKRYGPFEKEYIHKDGHLIPVLLNGLLIHQMGKEVIWSSVQDISQRKQAEIQLVQSESALRSSKQFLQTVLNSFPLAVFWKNRESIYLGCNQLFAEYSGVTSPLDVAGNTNFDFYYSQDEANAYLADDQEVINSGEAKLNIEGTITLPSGEQRWVQTNKIPLRDFEGNVIALLGTFQDITERVEITAQKERLYLQLTSELNQKETLLKEIHHRVKNNLQIMSSLLRLQFRRTSPEVRAIAEEYQNRIQSMALIHDQLYRSEDLSHIDFYSYLENLAANLFNCFSTNPELIKLNLEVDDISLPLDLSIPLGLIINELLSNTLKYAFPQGHGEINIKLETFGKDICLVVADNGIGLPLGFDYENTESLGMQLVLTLTDQLGGIVNYIGDDGAAFHITFPMQDFT